MVRKSDGILNQPKKEAKYLPVHKQNIADRRTYYTRISKKQIRNTILPARQGGTYAELAPKKQRQAIHNLVLSFYPDNRCTDYCRNTADNRFSRARILHMPETAPNHSFYRTVLISYIRSCVLDHFRAFMEYLIQIRSINTPY